MSDETKYTVMVNIEESGYFVDWVMASNKSQAFDALKIKFRQDLGFDYDDDYFEFLDVYEGHLQSAK